MTTTLETPKTDWLQTAHELGRTFAGRAADHDSGDKFVAANFNDLKAAKAFSAQIPQELGGGGLSYEGLCEFLRILGSYCGSTALSFSMHNHLVAVLLWKRDHQGAPVDPLLKRIAGEQLVLVSTGGSDFLQGSGTLEKTDGGYLFNGRKIFSSGSPLGDVLVTMGVYEDPEKGSLVYHFSVPFNDPGLKILDTWRVLGMRGTGSNDIEIKNVFIPDAAVQLSRPKGKWHPAMHLVAMRALPIIYSVYTGVAEGARRMALAEAKKRNGHADTIACVGEMENAWSAAELAYEGLVRLGASGRPGEETTNRVLSYRTLSANASIDTVEKAMNAVGGKAFYRALGLERAFRDVQAAKFHPLQEKPQVRFAGRFALGLPIDD